MMFDYTNVTFKQVTHSADLWIDFFDNAWIDNLELFLISNTHINRLFFYDWFDGCSIYLSRLSKLRKLAENYKVIWLTQNQIPLSDNGITSVTSDFMWNRTKSAYLDKRFGWKQSGIEDNYRLTELDFESKRSRKYISTSRIIRPHRSELIKFLKNYNGYLAYSNETRLPGNQQTIAKVNAGMAVLPATKYLIDCYISCQVESVDADTQQILITEKTYDTLIQGLIVLNFSSPGFYNSLQQQGWKLPIGIDLSWDSETDTEIRFNRYLECLFAVLDQPLEQLHELYVANRSVIEHNRSMLITKLYDTTWTQLL
jgi:hypothetical protein